MPCVLLHHLVVPGTAGYVHADAVVAEIAPGVAEHGGWPEPVLGAPLGDVPIEVAAGAQVKAEGVCIGLHLPGAVLYGGLQLIGPGVQAKVHHQDQYVEL
ncbi:hypothetical protein SDC9_169048 [bioreactor metagenome]|uniref:Uncharacterized protein n=1 Tax=bioreactor metagenome TaxID=1076179 RepID=A0A645G483_9ZZZZ